MSYYKDKINYIVSCITPEPQDGVFYYFYKITTDFNDRYYYGVHKTTNLDDGYPGSGYELQKDISKFGISHFKKEILKFFNSLGDMYEYENKIVTQEIVDDKLSYNLKLGGFGGWENSVGFVTVRDVNGECFRISKDDIRYLSGEVSHNMVGRVNVVDIETGVHLQISTEEYKNNKNKYNAIFNNKVVARDKDGNVVHLTKEEYDNGDYVGLTKGFGVFKDKDGNSISCDINDPRVLSGELVGYTKDKTIFKRRDDFSKTMFLEKDDPRVLSGEYVGINFGMVYAYDKLGNKVRVTKDEYKEKIKSGELISSKVYLSKKKEI